jgi:hypothetical protein
MPVGSRLLGLPEEERPSAFGVFWRASTKYPNTWLEGDENLLENERVKINCDRKERGLIERF